MIMIEQFRVEDSYARRYGIDAGDEKGKETSNQREIEESCQREKQETEVGRNCS
jgi:ribosomal protein L9